MHPADEAWGRFAATTKYSVRRTLAVACASGKAVRTSVHDTPGKSFARCEVCGRPLQVGYKVLLPTGQPRTWAVGYVHTHPFWCRVAQGEVQE